ncbi:MAG: hypothetical protein QM764_17455 [Chitinophagaceae bacterium]
MFIRYSTLVISLLMVIIVTIIGSASLFDGGDIDKSLLFIIGVDFYYFLILFFWRKYQDLNLFQKRNTLLFSLSIIPLLALAYIFYMMSKIEC